MIELRAATLEDAAFLAPRLRQLDLAEIMRDTDAPHAARVAAARELIDRGFGRATQPISGDPTAAPVMMAARALTDDELQRIASAA